MEKRYVKSNAINLVNLMVIGSSSSDCNQYSPQHFSYFREISKSDMESLNRGISKINMESLNGKSLSDNVHETILKDGLDYLTKCARKGEDVEEKIFNALGRAYDLRPDWHTDYQFKLMNAMKRNEKIKNLKSRGKL